MTHKLDYGRETLDWITLIDRKCPDNHNTLEVQAKFTDFRCDASTAIEHTVKNIVDHCDNKKIPHVFHDFQLMNFLESGQCLSLQKKYKTSSPQIAAHIHMLDGFSDGTQIMSGNLCIGRKPKMPAELWGLVRYAKESNSKNTRRKNVPFFYLHDFVIGTFLKSVPPEIHRKYLDSHKDVKVAIYQKKFLLQTSLPNVRLIYIIDIWWKVVSVIEFSIR